MSTELMAGTSGEGGQYLVAQASNTGRRSKTTDIKKPEEVLDDVVVEIGKLEDSLEKLQRDHQDPNQLFPADEMKRQYEEAIYLYLVEDYEKAALLFHAVLEKADRMSFPEYEDAEYYLAESLSLGHNYYTALRYFTRIVEYGPSHRFYSPAVVSMVELYGKTGDYERFSEYYSSYIEKNAGLEATSEILYALGKNFYAQGDYDKALEIFSSLVTAGGNYPYTAGYFVGVIHVVRGEYDDAIEAFEQVLKLSVTTDEQRKVEDLAYLALGRIYYEQGKLSEALTNYGSISRDSAYFADALYEQSWTFIKQGDYDQAIRVIDVLLLTFPDNINVPRLKLVRGSLQQRRGAYDEALDTYQKLVSEYTGLKEELDDLMGQQKDVLAYFKELVDTDISQIESSFIIPALAVRFAASDKDMTRALDVARELKVEQKDLEASGQLIETLEEALREEGGSSRNILIGMRRLREELSLLQNSILLARERVIQCEQAYLAQLPSESIREGVRRWSEKNPNFGSLGKELPDMRRDFTEEMEVYEDQVKEVQRNVYKVERLVEDQLARAAALDKYITYSRESKEISPEREQEIRFKIEAERQELTGEQQSLEQIKNEIAALDVRSYVLQGNVQEEAGFRREAGDRLNRAQAELTALRKGARSGAAFFQAVDSSHERLTRLSGSVSEFYGQLDAIEEAQVKSIRESVAREKGLLESYGEEARECDLDTNELSEKIARRSFTKIHEHFSDLILNADFGVTDVYWELKEEKSNEIEQNQAQRADELGALQQKFSGLQSGDL